MAQTGWCLTKIYFPNSLGINTSKIVCMTHEEKWQNNVIHMGKKREKKRKTIKTCFETTNGIIATVIKKQVNIILNMASF